MRLLFFVGICLFASLFPAPLSAHSEIKVIEMTKNGFEPPEVTVDENASIVFINKDDVPRWPASNVHPTHEIYPEFDPKREIAPGDSWAFRPKIGVWKFHDHMHPHMRGEITVVAEASTSAKSAQKETPPPLILQMRNALENLINRIKTIFASRTTTKSKKELPQGDAFKKLSSDIQAKELTEIAKTNGAIAAWQFINDVFKGEAGSTGNIHDLAHLAGALLYKEKGFDGITNCTANFSFGCYHGLLDSAFEKNLDHLLEAQDACMQLSKTATVTGPAASCIHGIGHGVASFYLTTDLKRALSTCRTLLMGQEYCFDGVFMEFVRSAPEPFYKKDDPLFPCDMLEKEFGYIYSFSCGRNQPSLLMGRFAMGFDDVIATCKKATSKPFQEACSDALGFSLAATGDVNKIIAGCKQIWNDVLSAKCLTAAAGELVFQEVAGWQEKSKAVCNAAGRIEKDCISHVDRLIQEYGRKTSFQFREIKNNEDVNAYVRDQMNICYKTGGRDGCYREVADVLYNQFGLKQTLAVFKTNEGYPEVFARCHEVTHYLSRLEYKKKKDISKVYAQCDSTCHGGCYHGTMEAYLKEKTEENGTNLTSKFAGICGKNEDYQKPIEFNECVHGMGHAAMFVTNMELIQSLALCDTIDKQEYKERCYTGVFMENSSSSTSFDHASKFIKQDDPFYPCTILEEKYQSLCWQYQSSYFSIISDQDWKKVANLCLQIPQTYQDRCFRTIGTNQVGFTQSLTTMKKDCDFMPTTEFKDICISGVVSSLSYRFVGEMEKMIEFCSLVDSDNKESCYKQIGSGILDWDRNTDLAKKTCQQIPDLDGKNWCTSVM